MFDNSDVKLYFSSLPPIEKLNKLTSKHFTDKAIASLDALFDLGAI